MYTLQVISDINNQNSSVSQLEMSLMSSTVIQRHKSRLEIQIHPLYKEIFPTGVENNCGSQSAVFQQITGHKKREGQFYG